MERRIGLILSAALFVIRVPLAVSLPIQVNALDNVRGNVLGSARPRIAVLTSGLINRFMFTQFTANFLDPMIRAGYDVEYYATLANIKYSGWLNDTDTYKRDPIFEELSDDDIVVKIHREIESHGGKIQYLKLTHGVGLEERDESYVENSSMFNFGEVEHARNTRKGVIKHWKGVHGLLQSLKQVEKDENLSYTYLMYQKDDFRWLRPFQIDDVLAASPLRTAGVPGQANVYTHCCSHMASHGPSSWGSRRPDTDIVESMMIFERAAATSILDSVYEELLRIPSDVSIEQLLARMVQERTDVHVNMVPATSIPGQRVGYRDIMHDGHVITSRFCFHYLCTSFKTDQFGSLKMCHK
jgi:hypothetical protein